MRTSRTLRLRKALIIVDVQNDFCPGGALAVNGGDKIVAPINKMVELAVNVGAAVFATRDWHPEKTSHFKDFGGVWPAHCVQGTKGAEFHPGLDLKDKAIILSKGVGNGEDAYSGFNAEAGDGRLLIEFLHEWGVDTVYVAGLATDYCVKETVLDAIKKGFKTFLIDDCCRAVNINPNDGGNAVRNMMTAGATIISSDNVYF